jgi:hypothetical protein
MQHPVTQSTLSPTQSDDVEHVAPDVFMIVLQPAAVGMQIPLLASGIFLMGNGFGRLKQDPGQQTPLQLAWPAGQQTPLVTVPPDQQQMPSISTMPVSQQRFWAALAQ